MHNIAFSLLVFHMYRLQGMTTRRRTTQDIFNRARASSRRGTETFLRRPLPEGLLPRITPIERSTRLALTYLIIAVHSATDVDVGSLSEEYYSISSEEISGM